ncbi:MAG: quinone oxidoreductase, partial [Chloroflexota bacterium]
MKAIRIYKNGDPDVMQYEDVPQPEPGEGQIRVKVKAAGVNFIDIYQRSGLYPVSLPSGLGFEGAGIVDMLGPGVTDLKVGDRVAYAFQHGSYAEEVIIDADKVVPMPDNLDFASGAAAMLQGMTAHYLVYSTYPLKSGETILVQAAAGGVGLLLVQMAKALGATVIGTVSTEEKARLAREAGADHVIRYTETDFAVETERITGGSGVHVVYDSVGKTTFEKSLSVLRPRGYMVTFGQSSGPIPPVDTQLLSQKGSLFMTRPTLGSYIANREELLWRASDLFAWIAAGDLKLRIDHQLPLS